MLNPTIEHLLQKIFNIYEKYEQHEILTGSKFNVFDILGASYAEVQHSRFLAELLNPFGSHGLGEIFLTKFIDLLPCKTNLIPNTASVVCEFYIGAVTEKTGGRIDILIKDAQNNKIIIENKIYAADQKNQLLRYHNYAPKAPILYLTLDTRETDVTNTHLKLNEHYYNITYKKMILEWLDVCIKEAAQKPLVRETLQQYHNLIKKLTHQTHRAAMSNEIINLLSTDKKYCAAAIEIIDSFPTIKAKVQTQFFDKINALVESKKNISTHNNLEFRFHSGQDNEGFFYGCNVFKEGNPYNEDGKVHEHKNKIFAKMTLSRKDKLFVKLGNWLCWTFPDGFYRVWKFEKLSNKEILELLFEDNMAKFVGRFEAEFDRFIAEVKSELSKIDFANLT